ncbi:MAG: ComEC/Rec2 family competence protein [Opitutae bacterium]|nr:ComEC/Rec2 family competence protein [Opitutae bacterium]
MPSPNQAPRAPLLWLLLPYMAGVALADYQPLATRLSVLATLAVAAGGVAVCTAGGANRLSRALWITGLGGAALLGGYVNLLLRSPGRADWAETPREVTVTVEIEQTFAPAPGRKTTGGVGRIVAAEAHVADLTGQRIYYSAIRKISLPPVRSARYVVRGVLQNLRTGDESTRGFNRYLESLGIGLTLTRAHITAEVRPPTRFRALCTRLEDRFETILRHGLERRPEQVSIYLGMLLGEKAALDPEQQNAFMRSGTFHIFSISGLHVGVIALAIQYLLQLLRLPRRAAVVVGLVVLWLYVQVTGGSAPAERAFLMIAFLLGSRLFRLPANSLAALVAAALVTLLLDPQQQFNTGFQMSYGVVAALILMAGPLAESWQARWRPWRDLPAANWSWRQRILTAGGRGFLGAAAATWVALLASIPSSIGYFGLFSPGSLPANLVVIPLSWLAIVAGFASLVCGLVGLLPLSLLCNRAAALVIQLMDWLVQHGTALPAMYFPAQFSRAWLAPVALGLVLGVMLAGANARWARARGGFWPPVLVVVLVLFFGVKFGSAP